MLVRFHSLFQVLPLDQYSWVLDMKLAGVNEILVFEHSQPQPRGFPSRHSSHSWEKRLQFPSLPSSAHFQPSSSMFLYRSSTSLVFTFSNLHQVPVGLFPSCSFSKSMRLSPTHGFNYLFLSLSFCGQQACPQAQETTVQTAKKLF